MNTVQIKEQLAQLDGQITCFQRMAATIDSAFAEHEVAAMLLKHWLSEQDQAVVKLYAFLTNSYYEGNPEALPLVWHLVDTAHPDMAQHYCDQLFELDQTEIPISDWVRLDELRTRVVRMATQEMVTQMLKYAMPGAQIIDMHEADEDTEPPAGYTKIELHSLDTASAEEIMQQLRDQVGREGDDDVSD